MSLIDPVNPTISKHYGNQRNSPPRYNNTQFNHQSPPALPVFGNSFAQQLERCMG